MNTCKSLMASEFISRGIPIPASILRPVSAKWRRPCPLCADHTHGHPWDRYVIPRAHSLSSMLHNSTMRLRRAPDHPQSLLKKSEECCLRSSCPDLLCRPVL